MYENSVYEMPWSGRSSRLLTDSLATIWLTVKCLPVSRRNSKSPIGESHAALSRSSALESPAVSSKSKKRPSCARMAVTLDASSS